MTLSVYASNRLNVTKVNDAWSHLFDLIPPEVSVLDVGCSSGNFGRELITQKQCTVTGIDINEDDLKIAQKHLTKALRRNVEQDEINDLGKFDVILMADVIEHLVDPVAALQKLSKQLKPEGKLVFSVPNMANFATRLELLAGRFEYTEFGILDETHLHYYDRIELEKVLTNAGFKVSKYDNTIRDVPERAAEELLEQSGLKTTKKFWKLAQDMDAISFQFIGLAERSTAAHTHLASKTPHDFVSSMIDKTYAEHAEQKKNLQQRIAQLQAELKSSRTAQEAVQAELGAIKQSKGWRLLTRIYTFKSKFRRSN